MSDLSRRSMLKLTGLAAAAPVAASRLEHAAHTMGPVGCVSTEHFDPAVSLRSFNFSHLPPAERSRVYQETPRPDGSLLREYRLTTVDREVDIAHGMCFPRWT